MIMKTFAPDSGVKVFMIMESACFGVLGGLDVSRAGTRRECG
jgi:hypothetical protein